MHTRPLVFASPQVSLNRRARWPVALLFSVFIGASLAGCASLPTDVARPVSTAQANPGETRLGQAVAARAAKAGTRNDSGFALVSSAELAFTSRMTLIKAAQKTLNIQYYAIFADDTTKRVFDALREAVARGVRIRILLDDFNTSGENAEVLKLAFEKNMEMRLFNPLPGGRGSLFFRIIRNLWRVCSAACTTRFLLPTTLSPSREEETSAKPISVRVQAPIPLTLICWRPVAWRAICHAALTSTGTTRWPIRRSR